MWAREKNPALVNFTVSGRFILSFFPLSACCSIFLTVQGLANKVADNLVNMSALTAACSAGGLTEKRSHCHRQSKGLGQGGDLLSVALLGLALQHKGQSAFLLWWSWKAFWFHVAQQSRKREQIGKGSVLNVKRWKSNMFCLILKILIELNPLQLSWQ